MSARIMRKMVHAEANTELYHWIAKILECVSRFNSTWPYKQIQSLTSCWTCNNKSRINASFIKIILSLVTQRTAKIINPKLMSKFIFDKTMKYQSHIRLILNILIFSFLTILTISHCANFLKPTNTGSKKDNLMDISKNCFH